MKNLTKNFIKRHFKNRNEDLTNIQLLKFIETTFNYAKMCLNTYSNYFSNHLYTQPVLFTILALKNFILKSTFREYNSIFYGYLTNIIKYLRIKKVPHYTTIQKFFQKLPSGTLRKINQLILSQHDISGEIIALDGSGFTNDYADKYYAIIRAKERKSYVKNHNCNRHKNSFNPKLCNSKRT